MIEQKFQLAPMPQLENAVDKDDDWTGLTDAAARRKRQNRLAQRAWRRRKALEARDRTAHQPESSPVKTTAQPQPETQTVFWIECQQRAVAGLPLSHTPRTVPLLTLTPPHPPADRSTHTAASAPPPIIFPLSPDHLIVLVQFNVLRAIITNLTLLSLLDIIPAECSNVRQICTLAVPATVPPALKPTALQRRVPHAEWIDVVPLARWRDNLIMAAGTYDEDEMCSDTVGGLFEGFADCECRGLIAWSDPWDVSGWEVSEGFWKKWGWTLKGCERVLEATNQWREVRGEDHLVVEL